MLEATVQRSISPEVTRQANEHIKETSIPGVFIIKMPTNDDERGFFRETVRKRELDKVLGYNFEIAQENHSRSKKGVLRGIHVAPWNKLTYVPRGKVQQVVVDLREDSPTFGQHISIIMGEEDRIDIFVPAGCGNAFLVLSGEADYIYLTDDYWSPGKEIAIAWNDPDLAIPWETKHPILSEKDNEAPRIKELFPQKFT